MAPEALLPAARELAREIAENTSRRLGRAHPPDAVADARRRSSARGAPPRLARHVAHGPLRRRLRGRHVVPREAAAALHRPAQQGHAALLSRGGHDDAAEPCTCPSTATSSAPTFTPAKRGDKPGERARPLDPRAGPEPARRRPTATASGCRRGECPLPLHGRRAVLARHLPRLALLGACRCRPTRRCRPASRARRWCRCAARACPTSCLSLGGMAMQALWWESTSGHCPRCGDADRAHRERVGQAVLGAAATSTTRTCTRPPSCSCATATACCSRARPSGRPAATRSWPASSTTASRWRAACAREIKEEVGVDVKDIRYVGSQNWPFPSQMMIGFVADLRRRRRRHRPRGAGGRALVPLRRAAEPALAPLHLALHHRPLRAALSRPALTRSPRPPAAGTSGGS